MQQLFQSTFLQSLGYAIANSLWQTALVWLIYISITGIRTVSAAVKYRLAVAAQVIGFVWFIFTFQFYYSQYSHALQSAHDVPQNIQAILSSNTDISSRVINWMVRGEQLLPYISMAYLLLMVFLCVRWFFGYRQTQIIRNNGLQKMPARWRLFVNRIAEQLNIKNEIKIFLSDTISTPLTIGFLKPVILIPVASINHLTTDQLEAVLLHELAHIKRYDYLVNIILSVVEISLFFNPFTQLLSKSIHKERENSCDDWVLQFQYDASVYAEALLRIAYLQAAPAFAMAATGKKNELLTRVKRMIGEKETRFSYKKQLLAFVIVTGILSSIAWLNPHVQQKDDKILAKTSKELQGFGAYTVEPMAVSIDNPLFNPVFFLSKPLKEEMQKNIASAQKEIDESLIHLNDELKEPLRAIRSVTPLVANAMREASNAFDNAEFESDIAQTDMDLAKTQLGNNLYSDSAFFKPMLKKQWRSDMGNSMKEVEDGLQKAKAAFARNFKADGEMNLDKINMGKDFANVMSELGDLGKAGLDKIVINSLKLSSDLLNDVAVPRINNIRSVKPKENPKTKQRKPAPVPVADKNVDEESIRLESGDKTIEIPKEEHNEIMLNNLSSLLSVDGIADVKLDEAVLLKIKNALLKVAKENKLKLTSLVNKEKKEEDKKMVIAVQ
jgi:bla regulator protein BlaR1